jgi:uncharacterized repeat protein (TIGR04138 family)
MTTILQKLLPVVRSDPRYTYEAYEFVFQAIDFTLRSLGRDLPDESSDPHDPRFHLSGRQLVEGMCEYARREFGMMARTVFRMWGVHRTDDFGEIVFNLIDAGLMSRTDDDSRADFHALFDLDETLDTGFKIVMEEE